MSDHKEKTRTISLIETGTVIDHLNPHVVFQVVKLLDIDDNIEDTVTVGTNLQSAALGKKGIIKIANRFLTQEDVDKLSIVSPNATVSIIEHYDVVKKFKVSFPKEIVGIIKCPNPNCVTNVENVEGRFRLVRESPIFLLCTYCERYIRESEIKIV
ncbi:MAG: aspartate carbamoyltransferase regulatory subunit [bacterium]|nr:aspartate carbamoyltransferase regulatory subunit [bacterium]